MARRRASEFYKRDLAFVHDTGFAELAVQSADGIIKILRRSGIRNGLVVELGCGSGRTAEALQQSGYQVLGIDISSAMIDLARQRVPSAEFRVESLFSTKIPGCDAVIALGEGLNYAFESPNDIRKLTRLFRRVHDSLRPGGLFIFDIAEPGQMKDGETVRSYSEGTDWLVLVEKREDARHSTLSRRIATFRKVGEFYRRDDETHRQRLFKAADLEKQLKKLGFNVRIVRRYGRYRLLPARAGFIARKQR